MRWSWGRSARSAALVFVVPIKFGGKWYSDSDPGWFGGHWWWVAVAAAAGVAVGLVRRLTRLPLHGDLVGSARALPCTPVLLIILEPECPTGGSGLADHRCPPEPGLVLGEAFVDDRQPPQDLLEPGCLAPSWRSCPDADDRGGPLVWGIPPSMHGWLGRYERGNTNAAGRFAASRPSGGRWRWRWRFGIPGFLLHRST